LDTVVYLTHMLISGDNHINIQTKITIDTPFGATVSAVPCLNVNSSWFCASKSYSATATKWS